MNLPIIAIVGRPNVGKSTLFNRLIGQRRAIVHDQPGITRDRNYGVGEWSGHSFTLIDTGGYEVEPESDLFAQMRRQVEIAMREADLILWVVDGRSGLTSEDREMAERLRKLNKKVFLVINKIEEAKQESSLGEFYELGISSMFPVSAEHGRGVSELLEEIVSSCRGEPMCSPSSVGQTHRQAPVQPGYAANSTEFAEYHRPASTISIGERISIRVTIVGRPNVGKSTLLNRLFGAPRAVVHPEPGTTRDPLDIEIEERGSTFRFIDTAGIRRKSHAEGKVEKVSVLKALQTVEKSDVVLLLVDGQGGVTSQDAKISERILQKKRALILLVNRCDLLSPKISRLDLARTLKQRFPHLEFIPILAISAKTGLGLSRLFGAILKVYEEYSKRLSTSALNRAFRKMIEVHPPPVISGRTVNLFYMTQVSICPPHFVIFANHPQKIPESYRRYLMRELRRVFSFQGTPLQLEFRARKKKPFHA